MIVTTVLDVPYTMLRESPQSNLTGNDRYFVDLVDAISKVLNFSYVLKNNEAGAYGSLVQTGTWNGIIGELMDGRAHIGAGAISITAERYVVKDSILLEYLCEEVLELSGDVCIQNKEKRITPRHIKVAIENDVELRELLKDVTIAEGGRIYCRKVINLMIPFSVIIIFFGFFCQMFNRLLICSFSQ